MNNKNISNVPTWILIANSAILFFAFVIFLLIFRINETQVASVSMLSYLDIGMAVLDTFIFLEEAVIVGSILKWKNNFKKGFLLVLSTLVIFFCLMIKYILSTGMSIYLK